MLEGAVPRFTSARCWRPRSARTGAPWRSCCAATSRWSARSSRACDRRVAVTEKSSRRTPGSGCCGAIRAWQPDRGPFGAFAARCARGQVIKALDRAGARKHQLLSRAVSLDPPSSRWAAGDPAGEVSRASLYDVIASNSRLDQPVAMLLAREELDRVLAALPTLTARERAALTGVLNGKSHQQLAAEHGSTRKAIALALRRARRKLAAEEPLAA